MRMLIMGPPGSGKGTQAVRLAASLGVPAISTGDIFRTNIAAATPLGREAEKYTRAGKYVPDDITNRMVRARLRDNDAAEGWLLDGYPRTLAQVNELDEIAAEKGHELDVVIALEVEEGELVRRLAQRALDEGRVDDTEQVIRHRQLLFRQQTAPLMAAYDERGLLHTVDGDGDVDNVGQRILDALAGARPTRLP
jgi:adenylate kinase